MASVVGGGLTFSTFTGQTVILGLNDGVDPPFPNPVAGDLNIEVFTAPGLTTLPALDAGFNQGILDPGGFDQTDGTLFRDPVTLFGGDYLVADSGFPPAVIQLGSGAQSIVGATGDTLLGGTGDNQVLNGLQSAGAETIVGGSGANTDIFGGFGDSITAGTAGSTYIDGTAGAMQIVVGASGSNTIFGSLFDTPGSGLQPDTITGGGADVLIEALGNRDVINFANETGNSTINALIDSPTQVKITLGSGGAVVFGGSADTITFGSGAQYFDGEAGKALINVGASGSDTIFGSLAAGAPDTLVGGGADVEVQGLGKGDLVNFAGETGTSLINALSGDIALTFGSGSASVYAAAGDTVTYGSGDGYGDGLSGGALFNLGPSGTDTVYGFATVTGGPGGDTIVGTGGAALDFNTEGGGSDSIDLGRSTGSATINAFHFGGQQLGFNTTVIASQGSDEVFGGDGDRIGVADAHTTVGNTHLWTHGDGSQTVGSVSFGTNDTVSATNYDTTAGTFSIDTTTGSNAQVTIGGGAGALLGNFQPGNDFLFYQGESGATNAEIVATAQAIVVNGVNSAQIALPDGTVMTLVGVTPNDLLTQNNAGTLFKP